MGAELGDEGDELLQRFLTGEGRDRRIRKVPAKGRSVSRVRFTEERERVGGGVGVQMREVRGCIYVGRRGGCNERPMSSQWIDGNVDRAEVAKW